jgi:hypothetical protein
MVARLANKIYRAGSQALIHLQTQPTRHGHPIVARWMPSDRFQNTGIEVMENRTKFQEKAIRRFYNNRDEIAVQRLQELVTDLYLSEGKKRAQHWKHAITHLEALKVPAKQIEHLVKSDKPELIAQLLQNLAKK